MLLQMARSETGAGGMQADSSPTEPQGKPSVCGQNIGVSVFSISPSNEYPGLISFRIDWFNLLGVQGTLKSLL